MPNNLHDLTEMMSNPAFKIFGAYLRHISAVEWRNKHHADTQLQSRLDRLLERPLGVRRNITPKEGLDAFIFVLAHSVGQDEHLSIYHPEEFGWMVSAFEGEYGQVALATLRVNVSTREADIWTVEKCATELGMSAPSIRRWCDDGVLIGATKQAKTWLIDPLIARRVKEIKDGR